jgi:uncharacterized protein (TIGR03790 family)
LIETNRKYKLDWLALLFGIISISIYGTAYAADIFDTTEYLESNSLQGKVNPLSLGVIVNTRDPHSIELARYYVAKRGIPISNLIPVDFKPGNENLSRIDFNAVFQDAQRNTKDHIQAYVLTWTKPFKVDCMSITSAFAFGFDLNHCANGCRPTKQSPYFDSDVTAPWSELKIRPTMMLAADNFENLVDLIDRGIESDKNIPLQSNAFIIETSDKNRSIRSHTISNQKININSHHALNIHIQKKTNLSDQSDVMFYFIGASNVSNISTNKYPPGAIADNLTSYGGVLNSSHGQTTVMDWIKNGITGSYGTVVEPCNFPQKFPEPLVAIKHYLNGDTLIEAYWKSVASPGQGLFVGEPLARPYGYSSSAN